MRGTPFVTALCLTRNRREWLPKAIKCWQDQTYSNTELLIVADGESVRDLIPSQPKIRLIEIDACSTIGEKRNFGCEQTAGEIVIHWDDDDFSAPERIAHQIQTLRNSGKAVCGFHSMRFTDGADWWQYEGVPNYSLGTSLCYRKDWWALNKFPALQIGEDNAMGAAAWNAGQMATENAGDLMYATIHPGNTSPRNMGSNWKKLTPPRI